MSFPDSELPLISVAVATFNRADTLRRALVCVTQLEASGFSIEAVVIDNGSTDHTRDTVASLARECSFPIRYFYESRPGLPFARNRAVSEASGQWIAFFDDDQLTDPRWLTTLFQTAQREKVLCVGGSRTLLIEVDQEVELTDYCRSLLGEIYATESTDYHALNLPCTGNVLIHTSLFETWGKFDESVLDGGEDSDFFNRVLYGGVRCVYDPNASVQHIISPNRLVPEYLKLIAFRHGRHVCRRDLRHRGRVVTFASAAARILWVGISTRCKIALAFMAARSNEIVSQSCKWRRACGYLSYALQNPVTQQEVSARVMHRDQ